MPRPKKIKETFHDKIFEYDDENMCNTYSKMTENMGFKRDDSGYIMNKQRYVINCFSEMIVIGKLNKHNERILLNEKDIEWCKKNKINYEKNL
jgi:hypothetical protein